MHFYRVKFTCTWNTKGHKHQFLHAMDFILPQDKSSAPDSLNSICVPESFGSGGLQAINKETKMKWGPGWNLGHLDLP